MSIEKRMREALQGALGMAEICVDFITYMEGFSANDPRIAALDIPAAKENVRAYVAEVTEILSVPICASPSFLRAAEDVLAALLPSLKEARIDLVKAADDLRKAVDSVRRPET